MSFARNKKTVINTIFSAVVLLMLLLTFMFGNINSNNIDKVYADPWSGTASSESITGAGSIANPYLITSAEGLAFLNELVNTNTTDIPRVDDFATGSQFGVYWQLGANIDLGGTLEWTPIGSSNGHFSGDFNGKGFLVQNLLINKPTEDYLGLFGVVSSATIRNLEVSNLNITGKENIAGVVGYAWNSNIKNCTTSGTINAEIAVGGVVGYSNNSDIKDCDNTATVSANGISSGGIVGSASEGEVTNCFNNGQVISTLEKVGGIVGLANQVTVSDSYNLNTITGNGRVGGILGDMVGGNITRVYNKGNIISTAIHTGGLVGYNDSGSIENSYNEGDLQSTNTHMGGIVGASLLGSITNTYNIGDLTTSNDYYGGIAGFSSATMQNNYYLQGNYAGGVEGADIALQAEEKTQVELQTENTYSNWDFADETINGNDDYWEIMPGLNNNYPFINMNYTVTFDMNGINLENKEAIGNLKGTLLPSTPIIEGYTFASWNTKSDNTGVEFDGGLQVSESIVIYANWDANEYSIIFNNNGGVGAEFTLPANYEQEISLPVNTFTREGYTFVGWDLSAMADFPIYEEVEGVSANYVLDEADNVTMFAIWGKDPVVTYLNNPSEVTITTDAVEDLAYGDNATYYINVKVDEEVLNILINGVAIDKSELDEALTNGLVMENMSGDITLEVTFVKYRIGFMTIILYSVITGVVLFIIALIVVIRKATKLSRIKRVRIKSNYKFRQLKKAKHFKKVEIKPYKQEFSKNNILKYNLLMKKSTKKKS